MLSKNLENALNEQINAEMYSSYMYLSMAAYIESLGLKGFANWMRVQVQEENAHAMKLYNFVIERGAAVKLKAIDAPPSKWKDILSLFEEVLKHEKKVTSLINNLVDISIKANDHATTNMLQWFINEQVEEEAGVNEILDQLKLIDGKGAGLFMMDKELKLRVFIPIQE